jgi:hypothetical protein
VEANSTGGQGLRRAVVSSDYDDDDDVFGSWKEVQILLAECPQI